MQEPTQREAFVPCAERIRVAVAELTAIFPQASIFHLFSRLKRLLTIFSCFSSAESNGGQC